MEIKYRLSNQCDNYSPKNSIFIKIGKMNYNLQLANIIQWENEIKKAKEELIINYKKENEGEFY